MYLRSVVTVEDLLNFAAVSAGFVNYRPLAAARSGRTRSAGLMS